MQETFGCVLQHGSPADIRRLFDPLSVETRTELVESTSYSGLKTSPFLFIIINCDLERLSVLLDMCTPVLTIAQVWHGTCCRPDSPEECTLDGVNRVPGAVDAALSSAVKYRDVRLLAAVLDELRRRGALAAVIHEAQSGTNITIGHALKQVIAADFAPALELLIDSGLSVGTNVSTRAAEHRGGARPRLSMAHFAASRNALNCLRLLHARMSGRAWAQTLCAVSTFSKTDSVAYKCTPLGAALDFGCRETFEFLLPFVPAEAVDPERASVAECAPELGVSHLVAALQKAQQSQSAAGTAPHDCGAATPDLTSRARAAFAGWDRATRTETRLVLRHDDAVEYAATHGCVRAITAFAASCPELFGGTTCATGAILASVLDAATAEALLRALIDTETVRQRAAAPGAAVVDKAEVRRRFASSSCSSSDREGNVRNVRSAVQKLIWDGKGGAARVLIRNSSPPDGTRHLLAGIPVVFSRMPSEGVLTARAYIEAIEAGGTLPAIVARASWCLLSTALSCGCLALSQLYVDKGADVFDRSPCDRSLFDALQDGYLACLPTSLQHFARRARADDLPAEADARLLAPNPAAVLPPRVLGVLADAEEERLVALALRTPDALRGAPTTLGTPRYYWAVALEPALGARWLWERMSERDPARARADLDACGPELLAALLDRGLWQLWRLARFLVARGVPLDESHARGLRAACRAGVFEVAAALFEPLASKDADPLLRNKPGNEIVLAIVEGVVTKGVPFPHALVRDLATAGACIPSTAVYTICTASSKWPGSLGPALRTLLECAQAIHHADTPHATK
jgi:hypothetical protein